MTIFPADGTTLWTRLGMRLPTGRHRRGRNPDVGTRRFVLDVRNEFVFENRSFDGAGGLLYESRESPPVTGEPIGATIGIQSRPVDSNGDGVLRPDPQRQVDDAEGARDFHAAFDGLAGQPLVTASTRRPTDVLGGPASARCQPRLSSH